MTSGQIAVAGRAVEVQVRAARPVRQWVNGIAAVHGADRRRHRARQSRAYQRHQSRPGLHVRDDRQRSAGQAEHRLVAGVRPGKREQRPAGVRRVHAAVSGREQRAGAVHADVVERLPASTYNGVALRGSGDPVLYVQNPAGVSTRRSPGDARRARASSTSAGFDRFGDPETQTRIAQYEMAFRMQTSVPELIDISQETQATLAMYGPKCDQPRFVRPQCADWPDGWSSAACAWCRFCIAAGISMDRCRRSSATNAKTPTRRRPRWCSTSSSAACSTRRSSSGAASSAAPSTRRATSPRPTTAATIIRATSACGWPAVASSRLARTANRRLQLQHRRGCRARERSQRHDPALPGHRPRAVHLQVPGPRPTPDRR